MASQRDLEASLSQLELTMRKSIERHDDGLDRTNLFDEKVGFLTRVNRT